MSESNLFDEAPATPTPVEQPKPTPTAIPDHLKELIGEGKKYATLDKALESIPHAQAHIQRLEEEARQLREQMAGAKAVGEVYETVQELLKAEKATPALAPVVDENAIASILDRKLAERQQLELQAANREAFKKALVDKFGDKAKDIYTQKAQELGVGEQFLDGVVSKSATAALALFGMNAPAKPVATTTMSSINTSALNNNSQETKPKPVMGGATTNEVLAAWRASAPKN